MTYDSWQIVLWLSTAIDAAVTLGMLTKLFRKASTVSGSRKWSFAVYVEVVLVSLGVGWILKLAFLLALGLSPRFGLIHLLYLDLVVVLPLIGLSILVMSRRMPGLAQRWKLTAQLAAVPLLLVAPVGVYASYIEPFHLTTERTEIPVKTARTGHSSVRIAVIADLQTERVGDYERKAIERVMSLKPDLILISGDIHQNTDHNFAQELPNLQKLFRQLSAPGGIFMVQGDTDSIPRLRQMTADSEVKLLYNQLRTVRIKDRAITIGGIQLDYSSSGAQEVVEQLESNRDGSGNIRILLTHRPDPVLRLQPYSRIDLVVAGHTHGGQVNPPLISPPLVLSQVPHRVGAGGLHDVGKKRRVYISRGIGVERGIAPRVRFGAPPEVSLLTLEDPHH